ncbi:MAG TPA: hypothetical protein VFK14_11720 [Solirubrobacterales bacterium]|nr:hypothetical protein [Solirubrobacterales bacterium]
MRRTAALTLVLAGALSLAGLAGAEVVQQGGMRVALGGSVKPHRLPRRRPAPVRVALAAKISSTKADMPPQLRRITLAINRYGHFDTRALPRCRVRDIQPSTTAKALQSCRRSLVGQGSFSANVALGRQAPFPEAGRLYAFNGTFEGHPAILAHVYGTDPVPTSFTLPFLILPSRGTFGTILRASLPEVTGDAGYVTGLSLDIGRTAGSPRYLTASCPAPKGFHGATFPLARASFLFAGKRTVTTTLTRSCKVRH